MQIEFVLHNVCHGIQNVKLNFTKFVEKSLLRNRE